LTIKSISDTEHSRSYLPISTLTALFAGCGPVRSNLCMPISYSVFKERKNLLAIPRPASSLFGDLVGRARRQAEPKEARQNSEWR